MDQNGKLLATLTYDAFGQTTTNGSDYPFQFAGRMPTAGGLYYFRSRFYSPDNGRFLSADRIGFAGDDTNLYAYVQNDPIDFIDPSGLKRTKARQTQGRKGSSGKKTTAKSKESCSCDPFQNQETENNLWAAQHFGARGAGMAVYFQKAAKDGISLGKKLDLAKDALETGGAFREGKFGKVLQKAGCFANKTFKAANSALDVGVELGLGVSSGIKGSPVLDNPLQH